jgi:hydroxymethylpyrimidine/phosphomethylpyrimidine kinase
MTRKTPPRLLTIAGSDSGGGAGIQADLKTFAAFGAFGMSVVTAVTAQNTRAVTAVHEIPPVVVEAQIDAVFDDLGVDAVKIGMLASVPIIEAVARALSRATARHGAVPLVLDPVMIAKSGDSLLRDDAVEALLERLLPRATLITPNLPEAERMVGRRLVSREDREAAARTLAQRGPAVLLKGGHGSGTLLEDLLFDGQKIRRFRHPRIETTSTHGTGCTLSSAIAAGLGAGVDLEPAVEAAIAYLRGALEAAYPLGSGHGPVDHLYRLFPA